MNVDAIARSGPGFGAIHKFKTPFCLLALVENRNGTQLTEKLRAYNERVESETGRKVVFRPFGESSVQPGITGQIKIGPSYEGIVHIEYLANKPTTDPEVEKVLAHELTHALLYYARGYLYVDAPEGVDTRLVQQSADVMDFIDDIVVDRIVQDEGFLPVTEHQLSSITNNTTTLALAKNPAQIEMPHPDDAVRSEINLVGQYIYAWALPRYLALDDRTTSILKNFQRIFPQFLAKEYTKAKHIKKLMSAHSIFNSRGREEVLMGALRLWKLDTTVLLIKLS